jgi:hypothetical protein
LTTNILVDACGTGEGELLHDKRGALWDIGVGLVPKRGGTPKLQFAKPGTPPSAFSGLGIGMVHGWVGNTGGT